MRKNMHFLGKFGIFPNVLPPKTILGGSSMVTMVSFRFLGFFGTPLQIAEVHGI